MKSALVFGVLVCWLEMVVFIEGQSYFRMKHEHSAMVAEAYVGSYGSYGPDKLVRMWARDDVNRAEEQQWYVSYDSSYGCSDGYFIRNKKYSDMVLGIAFRDGTEGWSLPAFKYEQPYSCSRRWFISGTIVENMSETPAGSGNHQVLTLTGTNNGDQVLTDDADGGTDQDWICDFS